MLLWERFCVWLIFYHSIILKPKNNLWLGIPYFIFESLCSRMLSFSRVCNCIEEWLERMWVAIENHSSLAHACRNWGRRATERTHYLYMIKINLVCTYFGIHLVHIIIDINITIKKHYNRRYSVCIVLLISIVK